MPSLGQYRCNLARATLLSALVLAAAPPGCVGEGDLPEEESTVAPVMSVVNKASQALSIGDVEALNGTYSAACKGHENDSWSIAVSGAPTLDNAPLSVIQNDTDCLLAVTEVKTADASFVPDTGLGLTGSFKPSASAFKDSTINQASDPVVFYANAMIAPADFSAPFDLIYLYSDDAAVADAAGEASYATVDSSDFSPSAAAPPDYGDGIEAADLQIAIDANDAVLSASGFITLTHGTNTAENYVLREGAVAPEATYDDVADLFNAGTQVAIDNDPDASDVEIDIEDLNLVGDNLPSIWSVIFRRVDVGDGSVPTFQVMKVTFSAPAL